MMLRSLYCRCLSYRYGRLLGFERFGIVVIVVPFTTDVSVSNSKRKGCRRRCIHCLHCSRSGHRSVSPMVYWGSGYPCFLNDLDLRRNLLYPSFRIFLLPKIRALSVMKTLLILNVWLHLIVVHILQAFSSRILSCCWLEQTSHTLLASFSLSSKSFLTIIPDPFNDPFVLSPRECGFIS